MSSRFLVFLALLGLFASPGVLRAATKVGNGDDGSDLEGAKRLLNGPIFITRTKAVRRLKQLNIAGIPGLGSLLPELENTKLYMAEKDVRTLGAMDASPAHHDDKDFVYARTFAAAHAATRFFPVALNLDDHQLIALHIHEALHRALPAPINENEDVVGQLTLAISAPEATQDSIRTITTGLVPVAERVSLLPVRKSEFGYGVQAFSYDKPSASTADLMHKVHSNLYPFGEQRIPVGIGLEASALHRNGTFFAGPLRISLLLDAIKLNSFEFGLSASAALNAFANTAKRNGMLCRDVVSFGFRLKKHLRHFYVENQSSVVLPSKETMTTSTGVDEYDFGSIVDLKFRTGIKLGQFEVGGFFQGLLANHFRITNNAGTRLRDSGRFSLYSAGPEVQWTTETFTVSLSGSFLLNPNSENFGSLGAPLSFGAGHTVVGANFSFFF
ncbi:MAG: hypothetical protein R3B54_09920 [Bdellovibrionota bacterium]